jgi:hypothetical protein
MLATKLLGVPQASSAIPVEYVGGYTQGFAGSTENITITFGGNLTGGLASSASAGDMVLIWFGVGSSGAASGLDLSASGNTQVALLFSNDTQEATLLVAYKFMGATPDSTLVLIDGTTSTSYAGAITVQVWRNVEPTIPMDVTPVTATGINSVLANPPAITPATQGAVIVSGAAGGHARGAQTYSSSNLTGFLSSGGDDSSDVTIGAGYNIWTSGSFDPSQFTFSGSDSTLYAWAAATLALRPDYTGSVPEYVAAATGAFTSTGFTLVINKPAGTVEGDLMIAIMGCEDNATWSGATDWVEVADQGSSPSLRIAYKVAGPSEPSSYTFTCGSFSGDRSGVIVTCRNAVYDTIGTIATGTSGTSDNTLTISQISAASNFSLIFSAVFRAEASSSISTPIDMTSRSSRTSTGPSFRISSQYVLSGATGSRSCTTSGASSSIPVSGVLFSVKPA